MKTKPFSIELSDEAEVDFDKSYEFYFEDSKSKPENLIQPVDKDLIQIIQEDPSTPFSSNSCFFIPPIQTKNLNFAQIF